MKTFKYMWKNYLIKFLIVLAIVGCDLLTKHFFYKSSTKEIIPFLIGFRNSGGLNTGGAWGVFSGSVVPLIIVTVIFLIAIILFEVYKKPSHPLYTIAISMVVGGAVGNFIDRIFLGGVRDFIYFIFWPSFPTFNFADCALCVGMVLLCIYILFVIKEDETPNNIKKEEKEK